MCNFTCAISKRNRASAQNPRIQGRSCQHPVDRPKPPRGRSHTFTQKGSLFHSFSLGTGSTKGAVFRCVVGSCSAGSVLRAQGSSGEGGFSRCARGEGWIASSACSGPVPLPLCACWVWRLGANGISRGRIRRACGRRCRFGQGGCRGCRVRRCGRGRGRGGGRRCGRC